MVFFSKINVYNCIALLWCNKVLLKKTLNSIEKCLDLRSIYRRVLRPKESFISLTETVVGGVKCDVRSAFWKLSLPYMLACSEKLGFF